VIEAVGPPRGASLLQLLGVESPGLTAALAAGERVANPARSGQNRLPGS
jgi:hypothetical protein